MEIAAAVAIMLVVAFPYVFYTIKEIRRLPTAIYPPKKFSVDLLSFIIPTPTSSLGKSFFTSVSVNFPTLAEETAALGLLVAFLAAGSLSHISVTDPDGTKHYDLANDQVHNNRAGERHDHHHRWAALCAQR